MFFFNQICYFVISNFVYLIAIHNIKWHAVVIQVLKYIIVH